MFYYLGFYFNGVPPGYYVSKGTIDFLYGTIELIDFNYFPNAITLAPLQHACAIRHSFNIININNGKRFKRH
jgi:hypothetical protein